MKQLIQGITKYLVLLIITSLLIFIPSGSIKNYNAWLLLIILFSPILVYRIYLYIKKPKLLKIIQNSKEKQSISTISSQILFIIGFIISGLDYKYKWTNIPNYVQIISCITLLIGYLLYAKIINENEYLFRPIEVEKKQKLIETGLYNLIRHPMYLSIILIFLSIPLILKSLYAFYLFLLFPLILIIKIKNEEKVLVKELKGYSAYKLKVKYKLIPYIW